VQLLQLPVPATGGWQQWQTSSTVLPLPAGLHRLRLQVINPGFNLNWLAIQTGTVATTDLPDEPAAILFPQPLSHNPLNLQWSGRLPGPEPKPLVIYDALGRKVHQDTLRFTDSRAEIHLPEQLFLSAGHYLLSIGRAPDTISLPLIIQPF
jgi:hypothetical protein